MEMANMYKDGDIVIQSDTKSFQMYVRAAELGYCEAYGVTGQYYERGIVVEEDMSKALELYKISAKKGSVHAHKVLALHYYKNEDIQKSIGHLKVAAIAGDQDSMNNLMEL